MKGASGRAASARIVRRLRQALESGRTLSYAELAAEAACSTRTVRNYLADAAGALGLEVVRSRAASGERRWRARAESPARSIEALGQRLARQMLRRIFPIEGTHLARAPRAGQAQIVVMARGAFEYREPHLRALRDWLHAAELTPRRPVRFHYASPTSGAAERLVWPLGIVVRDLARVYLAGMPEDAGDRCDVRTYCLERVRIPRRGKAIELLPLAEAGAPPPGLDHAAIEDALDVPFSVYPTGAKTGIVVRVHFTPEQAPHIAGRRWHRRQRVRRLRDGSLDLTFGPADRGEAEAWVRQWGPSCEHVRPGERRAR